MKKKSKIKILKDNKNKDNYTFIVDMSLSQNSEGHINGTVKENLGVTDMDNLDIKSMMANMKFKMGMITMPITCITIGDALEGVSGIFKDALANETTVGNNQTNSTQAMLMGLMASGMGNMRELNDFIVCSPADEKMMKSMMK